MNTGNVYNSPIMYPGGKSWLFKSLIAWIPADTQEIVSPFLGGGAMELNLAFRGVRVYAYDVCPHLVNFWRYWLKSPAAIQRHAKAVLATQTQETLCAIKTDFNETGFQGAVLYYVLNRLAFGGQTLRGSYIKAYEVVEGRFVYPLYKNHTQRRYVFPQSQRWQHPRVGFPLTVELLDFKESLSKHSESFAYLDPPYVEREDFYKLEAFDHLGLSERLKERENWILSYNNHPVVHDLYKGYPRLTLKSRNFNTGKKTSSEVIIFSHDIAESKLEDTPRCLR